MEHIVLKPFGWYPDGFTREALIPGDERDFGANAAAMKALGMIADSQSVAIAPAVPHPESVEPDTTPEAPEVSKPRRGRPPKQG